MMIITFEKGNKIVPFSSSFEAEQPTLSVLGEVGVLGNVLSCDDDSRHTFPHPLIIIIIMSIIVTFTQLSDNIIHSTSSRQRR